MLDWAGYEVKPLWAPYAAKYPDQPPQFTFMTNEANALAKLNAGLRPDVVRPYVGYVKDFADSGFFQPWTPSKIPNLKQLNTAMVKAGQYQGKQWGIPQDWGFDTILYRTDKVKPKAQSWSLLFDERYAGKIAWFDDLNQLVVGGLLPRVQEAVRPVGQGARAVEEVPRLEEARRADVLVVRDRHAGRVRRRATSGSRYAWPADWAAMKREEAEGRLHAAEGGRDLLDRDADARQGLEAPRARARVRELVELEAGRHLAREQLRLRPREHARPADSRRTC